MAFEHKVTDDWRDDRDDIWYDWLDQADLDNWYDDWQDLWGFLQDMWDDMGQYPNLNNINVLDRYLWDYLAFKFPTIYNVQSTILINTTSSNAVLVSINPPITKTQLLNEASKYNTYNALKNRLDNFDASRPSQPAWDIDIDNSSNARSRTSYKRYGLGTYNNIVGTFDKEITIKDPSSMEEGLQDLIFEMTNAQNAERFDHLFTLAITGDCTQDDYVFTMFYLEAEATINEMVMVEELGISLSQGGFAPDVIQLYQATKNGTISVKDLTKGIAIYHEKTDLFRVNQYQNMYNQLRQMGIQAGF